MNAFIVMDATHEDGYPAAIYLEREKAERCVKEVFVYGEVVELPLNPDLSGMEALYKARFL